MLGAERVGGLPVAVETGTDAEADDRTHDDVAQSPERRGGVDAGEGGPRGGDVRAGLLDGLAEGAERSRCLFQGVGIDVGDGNQAGDDAAVRRGFARFDGEGGGVHEPLGVGAKGCSEGGSGGGRGLAPSSPTDRRGPVDLQASTTTRPRFLEC